MGLDFIVAAILAGVGIYSLMATFCRNSADSGGTGPCGDCNSPECDRATSAEPRPLFSELSANKGCLLLGCEPRKSLKQFFP